MDDLIQVSDEQELKQFKVKQKPDRVGKDLLMKMIQEQSDKIETLQLKLLQKKKIKQIQKSDQNGQLKSQLDKVQDESLELGNRLKSKFVSQQIQSNSGQGIEGSGKVNHTLTGDEDDTSNLIRLEQFRQTSVSSERKSHKKEQKNTSLNEDQTSKPKRVQLRAKKQRSMSSSRSSSGRESTKQLLLQCGGSFAQQIQSIQLIEQADETDKEIYNRNLSQAFDEKEQKSNQLPSKSLTQQQKAYELEQDLHNVTYMPSKMSHRDNKESYSNIQGQNRNKNHNFDSRQELMQINQPYSYSNNKESKEQMKVSSFNSFNEFNNLTDRSEFVAFSNQVGKQQMKTNMINSYRPGSQTHFNQGLNQGDQIIYEPEINHSGFKNMNCLHHHQAQQLNNVVVNTSQVQKNCTTRTSLSRQQLQEIMAEANIKKDREPISQKLTTRGKNKNNSKNQIVLKNISNGFDARKSSKALRKQNSLIGQSRNSFSKSKLSMLSGSTAKTPSKKSLLNKSNSKPSKVSHKVYCNAQSQNAQQRSRNTAIVSTTTPQPYSQQNESVSGGLRSMTLLQQQYQQSQKNMILAAKSSQSYQESGTQCPHNNTLASKQKRNGPKPRHHMSNSISSRQSNPANINLASSSANCLPGKNTNEMVVTRSVDQLNNINMPQSQLIVNLVEPYADYTNKGYYHCTDDNKAGVESNASQLSSHHCANNSVYTIERNGSISMLNPINISQTHFPQVGEAPPLANIEASNKNSDGPSPLAQSHPATHRISHRVVGSTQQPKTCDCVVGGSQPVSAKRSNRSHSRKSSAGKSCSNQRQSQVSTSSPIEKTDLSYAISLLLGNKNGGSNSGAISDKVKAMIVKKVRKYQHESESLKRQSQEDQIIITGLKKEIVSIQQDKQALQFKIQSLQRQTVLHESEQLKRADEMIVNLRKTISVQEAKQNLDKRTSEKIVTSLKEQLAEIVQELAILQRESTNVADAAGGKNDRRKDIAQRYSYQGHDYTDGSKQGREEGVGASYVAARGIRNWVEELKLHKNYYKLIVSWYHNMLTKVLGKSVMPHYQVNKGSSNFGKFRKAVNSIIFLNRLKKKTISSKIPNSIAVVTSSQNSDPKLKRIDPLEYLRVPTFLEGVIKKLTQTIEDPKHDVRLEVNQLERRIERQEKENLATMKQNLLLKQQLEHQTQQMQKQAQNLVQDVKNNSGPQPHQLIASLQNEISDQSAKIVQLQTQNLTQELELQRLKSQAENWKTQLRHQDAEIAQVVNDFAKERSFHEQQIVSQWQEAKSKDANIKMLVESSAQLNQQQLRNQILAHDERQNQHHQSSRLSTSFFSHNQSLMSGSKSRSKSYDQHAVSYRRPSCYSNKHQHDEQEGDEEITFDRQRFLKFLEANRNPHQQQDEIANQTCYNQIGTSSQSVFTSHRSKSQNVNTSSRFASSHFASYDPSHRDNITFLAHKLPNHNVNLLSQQQLFQPKSQPLYDNFRQYSEYPNNCASLGVVPRTTTKQSAKWKMLAQQTKTQTTTQSPLPLTREDEAKLNRLHHPNENHYNDSSEQQHASSKSPVIEEENFISFQPI